MRMTKTVRKYLRLIAPRGVPNGLVEEKNCGYGITPWRAISLNPRVWPIVTAICAVVLEMQSEYMKKAKATYYVTHTTTGNKKRDHL